MTRRPRRRFTGRLPLAALREKVNKTQEQIAAEADLTQSSVARAERSADPTVPTLLRYLRAVGGTVSLTVSGDHAWMSWSPRTRDMPKGALPIDITALDEDKEGK